MPTARELLEQADALMRRNRKRDKGKLDRSTLTGVLEARDDLTVPPTVILPETPGAANQIVLDRTEDEVAGRGDESLGTQAGNDDSMPLDSLGDVPVLTDIVANWPEDEPAPARSVGETALDTRPSDAVTLAADAFPASDSAAAALAANAPAIAVIERQEETPADGAPQTTATVADDAVEPIDDAVGGSRQDAAPRVAGKVESGVPFLDDDFILEIPPVDDTAKGSDARIAAPATVSEAPTGPDAEHWEALAEELRMQVLQRLDLFTDTGLREQLGVRLSPIVERASAQLIETINRELGELVRGYVAEAIEREIDTWRTRATGDADAGGN